MKLADKILLHLIKYGRKDPSEILIPNFYHFGYEMDCFKLMKTGLVVEYEVKISRADFFNDFKKMQELFTSRSSNELKKVFKHDVIREGRGANRFFFVVPEGLVDKNEVPSHCGLMYYSESAIKGTGISTIKPAPLIHKREFQDYRALATSLSWREERWRRKSYKHES